MRIRILNTTFGLVVDGIVKPKSPKDSPFEVDEKLGLRLVREGIAEAVDGIESGGVPQYGPDTSKADLQSIANEYGIEVSAAATKQELIKALDDFFADALSDDPEGE